MPKALECKYGVQADHAQLYDILVSTLTDFVVFLMDHEGCIASWNPGVAKCLGYAEDDWVGQSSQITFTPEDRLNGQLQKELAEAAVHGQSADVRWHVRRDGSRLFVEGTLVALRNDKGELLGFSKVMRDITGRKQREQRLEDALAYAESIVDTVREPLLVLDEELRVRSANRAFYRTFHIAKDDAQHRRLADLADGRWNVPQLFTLIEELGPSRPSIEDFEFEYQFPDSGPKTLLLNARKLPSEGDQEALTLLAIEDVTGRRLAEQALAESEKQRRLVMNAVPALISYIDRDLCYRSANEAYERWFGVAPQDLIGRTVDQVFDAPVLANLEPWLRKVLAGEIVTFEETYPTSRDGLRTLQMTYTPDLDDRGQVQGFVVLGSDVTSRKRDERALRQSEERWRSLFERMTEGFFIGQITYSSEGRADDFRFIEVNPAFERLTGVGDAVGRTAREAIPGVPEELIARYIHAVQSGEPSQFEIFIPALQNRWYEARVRPTDQDRFAVLFVDITDRKKVEAQLRESERHQAALVTLGDQLRELRDMSSLTAAAMEIVGTTLHVARAGYGRVDPAGQYVTVDSDWTDGRVNTIAGSYRFQDFGEGLCDRLGNGEFIAISDVSSDPITSRDHERWKALQIGAVINAPLVENGKLAAILFVQDRAPRAWTEAELTFVRKVADRTWAAAERARALLELQASEEFTRSVLASSPDCVKVVSLDGRLITMNEGGCRQMEIDDVRQCLNQPWVEFWGDSKEPAAQSLLKAQEGHTSRFEGFCPTAKGTPKWWEVVVTPIHDSKGKPVRILSLSRDITDRKRDEQERQRLTRELGRSNEDLSQFAHIVAHDLQAPLRGISSFAQLLKRNAHSRLLGDEPEFLNQIVRSAQRMQDLVQALLRFAQLGEGEIQKKAIPMSEVVDAALQSLQVSAEETGATVICGELPSVTGDPVQLSQLFQNLIGNALKYGRVEVAPRVEISFTEEPEHRVFAIKDNGEGIPAQQHEHIFEPLIRLHGSDIPGSGLGLAMCQRIVNRHGGRIWVESEPGVGSTFFFTLPTR